LARHRRVQGSRSKAIVLVVAGAFTVATAASAAAATWPQGSSAPRAHDAAADPGIRAGLTVQLGQAHAVAQINTANQALQAYQLRDIQAEQAAARWRAAQERAAQAAKKAAAARAAQAAQAAQAAAQSAAQPAASQPAQSAPATPALAPSGSPQQIAAAMLGSFGWSSSQFSCLEPLWQQESGWSVTAANPDGAYGIPQALPGSKMASAGPDWQTDAATQIRWGLEYIQSLYGSPCGAWDHEQATGWY
jgi:nucleoid-associated protein YgaU